MDFQSFIGQRDIVEQLRVSISAAKQNKQALPHCLFLGSGGLGKTSLANIIAEEMEYHLVNLNPLLLKNVKDFYDFLLKINPNTILFIDEVHELKQDCMEILYPLMQDGHINYVMNSQDFKFEFKNLTVIAATTDQSLLEKPFIDRFPMKFNFEFYSLNEMNEIVERRCRQSLPEMFNLDPNLTKKLICKISICSKRTPRLANNLIRLLKDEYQCNHRFSLTRVMARNKIYYFGLDKLDTQILYTLYRYNTAGLSMVASIVGEKDKVIVEREPYLMHLNYVERTAKGRTLTEKGREYMELLLKNMDKFRKVRGV